MKTLIVRSVASSACATALAMGFIIHNGWPLTLVAVLGVLFLFERFERLSLKDTLYQCILFGLVFFGIVLNWLYEIEATKLIGDTVLAGLFVILTYFLTVAALTSGFVLFGLMYKKMNITVRDNSIIWIPALWVASEYFRSVFFSIFAMGDGGSIGQYWNFGVVGLAFMDTPLKYSSRIVGMLGMSFLVVCIAVSVIKILQRKWHYGILLMVPVIVPFIGWIVYDSPTNATSRDVRVGAVGLEGSIDDGYEKKINQEILDNGMYDVVVLPEYSNYFIDANGDKTEMAMPENVGIVIDSATQFSEGQSRNMLNFYTNDGRVLQQWQKYLLIPGGEYIPYIYHMVLFYSGNTNVINEFHDARVRKKAIQREKVFDHNDLHYGSLVCSGVVAPDLYRKLASEGASLFTNSASVSVLGVAESYYGQAEQMAKFIATANARTFIQAARGGPSYIISPDGKVTAIAKNIKGSEFIEAHAVSNKQKTPYSALGEWLVYCVMVALLLKLVWRYRGHIKHK